MKYMPVIIDHFSRYCVAIATPDQKSETIADAFFRFWVMRVGCPMRAHTDQGANFESSLFAELCQRCHIQKSRTLAYHPHANGSVDRMNRTLIHLLQTSVFDSPQDWDLYLEEVTFAYNTTRHRSTGRSPCSILFGDEARLSCELLLGAPKGAESINEFVAQLIQRNAEISESARLASNAAQGTSKDYYDVNVNWKLYKTGDVVYIRRGQIKVGECSKLAPTWDGPCLVVETRGTSVKIVMPNETQSGFIMTA
jgi:hypothetical protein